MNEFDNATPGSEGADDEFEYSNDSEDMSVDGLGSDMDELESAPSLYSYSSSRDGPYFLRDEYGRILNNKNELYALPAATNDLDESNRLDTQHKMMKEVLGGNYVAQESVRRALAPANDGTMKAILDVGSGAGIWAIEMAEEFPHASVVGVDLAPNTRPCPENCRWEADDVSLGLGHYHNSFDLVHARGTAHGISDYPGFIDDCADVLRAKGVLLLVSGHLQLYEQLDNGDKKSMDPHKSALQTVFFNAYNALKSKGSSVDAALMLKQWLDGNPKFEQVELRELYIPIGPWRGKDEFEGDNDDEKEREAERWNKIGERLRQDCISFASAFRPMLLSHGYFQSSVDGMIKAAKAEMLLEPCKKKRMWACWRYAAAVRTSSDADSRPPGMYGGGGCYNGTSRGTSFNVEEGQEIQI